MLTLLCLLAAGCGERSSADTNNTDKTYAQEGESCQQKDCIEGLYCVPAEEGSGSVCSTSSRCGELGMSCASMDCCEGLACGKNDAGDSVCLDRPQCASLNESCQHMDCCEGQNLACVKDQTGVSRCIQR
jgi:hypothetical protein